MLLIDLAFLNNMKQVEEGCGGHACHVKSLFPARLT